LGTQDGKAYKFFVLFTAFGRRVKNGDNYHRGWPDGKIAKCLIRNLIEIESMPHVRNLIENVPPLVR
jgi:hypothetical protein